MIKTGQYNEEVLFTKEDITKIGCAEIEFLREKAKNAPRQRIRLCAHKNSKDAIHEMIIIHPKEAYVRPHKHLGKSESAHIIEGLVYVVVFTEEGRIKDIIKMGDYGSGENFYYRISSGIYHSLFIVSDWLVFLETTKGPFKKEDTAFALWAPADDDCDGTKIFLEELRNRVNSLSVGINSRKRSYEEFV